MRGRALAAALAAASLGAAGCGLGGDEEEPAQGGRAPSATQEPTRVQVVESDGSGFSARAIYERDAPGVVTVISLFGVGSAVGAGGGRGEGSGFVLNDAGEIATNAHVIAQGEGGELRRASQVFVEFADGNQVEARIVGDDPNADIALLRVDPKGLSLRALPLGSSEDVEVGTPVAAIGSPFGEDRSLSVGVVSAVDRSIESLTDFNIDGAIQTDAAINPGNSGGPLVNARGEVIGINQQIKSRSGGGEGVGFAVPVDLVKRSLDQLREDGRARYPYVGIESVPLYPQLAERYDLPVKAGAWLQRVVPGGPASEAGLRGGGRQSSFQARTYLEGGDVVTRVDRYRVEDPDDLAQAIARLRPGQQVGVETWRDGERREVRVRLGERPPTSAG